MELSVLSAPMVLTSFPMEVVQSPILFVKHSTHRMEAAYLAMIPLSYKEEIASEATKQFQIRTALSFSKEYALNALQASSS